MAVFLPKRNLNVSRVNFVEYIESTGTQYIDTGVTAPCTLEFDIEFINIGARNLMGVSAEAGNYFGANESGFYELGGGIVSAISGLTRNAVTVTNTESNISLMVNYSVISRDKARNSTGNFMIFGGVSGCSCSAKLYACKAYEGGILVRDYYPCYDPDGVACLYDKVNKEYVYNSGTGEFVAGGAV